jgi:electron transfer flavoprotein beta subunit
VEAVRLVVAGGGRSFVLTLGPEAAADQLRDCLAVGIDRAIHLVTDGEEWDPQATAAAIVDAVLRDRTAGIDHDVLLFGNEAADSGDFQVAVRVAEALGLPWLTGVKSLEVRDGRIRAERDAAGGRDVFELPLPAVLAVREGLNRPRYPSIPGRLRARRIAIESVRPEHRPGRLRSVRLHVPDEGEEHVDILGRGPQAAPAVVDLLVRLGLVHR